MKLVLIGCGAVGRAVLELLPLSEDSSNLVPHHLWERVLIIEPRSLKGVPVLKGIRYTHIQKGLTPENLSRVLSEALERGDMVVDVSVNVDAIAVMEVCRSRGCSYLNTSMEDWGVSHPERLDPSPGALYDRSLYERMVEARETFDKTGPTLVVDHGMNPGLITYFALRGLEDVARAVGDTESVGLMRRGQHAEAARRLGLRTIHVSERDTQTLRHKRRSGEFYNTWSALGFIAESLDPVQIGYGTHEDASNKGQTYKSLAPKGGASPIRFVEPPVGHKNVRFLPVRGMDLQMVSFCPSRRGKGGKTKGLAIPHGEANSLSDHLTVRTPVLYRPSVYYVYQASPPAHASLKELRARGYVAQTSCHVATLPQIKKGYDAVGALLMFDGGDHGVREWWSGTILDVADVKGYGFKYSGPTVVQVAASILAAVKWILKNPGRGLLTAESLPYDQILRDCTPFLGLVLSKRVSAGFRKYGFADFLAVKTHKSRTTSHRVKSRRTTSHRAKSRRTTSHRAKSRRTTSHKVKTHKTKAHKSKLHKVKTHKMNTRKTKSHKTKTHRAKTHKTKTHKTKARKPKKLH